MLVTAVLQAKVSKTYIRKYFKTKSGSNSSIQTHGFVDRNWEPGAGITFVSAEKPKAVVSGVGLRQLDYLRQPDNTLSGEA
jgi:hypothetical protein